jgi:hypothetical protein
MKNVHILKNVIVEEWCSNMFITDNFVKIRLYNRTYNIISTLFKKLYAYA